MANINLTNVAPKNVADAHYANITDAHDLVNRLAGKISVGAAAGGELSGTYPNPAVLNSAILAKVLTGLNVVGSSIAATDTLLQAFGKLQSQLNGVLGGAIYQGVWNATTNSPALADGTGTKGHYYVVSVAGSQNLGSGSIDFAVGDWAIHNGTIYQKVDNTDAVSSVNGFIGAVNLTTADISEVTNLYFTSARVLAVVLTGFVAGSNNAIAATDTIAQALAKIQGQINARPNENATTIAAINHGAAPKTVLVDADEVTGQDSASSFSLIRTVWSDVWTYIKSKADLVYQTIANKDATGGYAGLTFFKINFKNAANTITSFFTNANTVARTYTFQNRDGTIADDTDLGTKQATLVSGTNIKTINSTSLLASGDIAIVSSKILQIVNGTYSTYTTSTSSTYAATGLSAAITLSSTSSKVLVLVTISGAGKFTGETQLALRLKRGSTVILNIDSDVAATGSTATSSIGTSGCSYLDSPASVSALTYSVELASAANIGTVHINAATALNASNSTITLIEFLP